MNIEEYAQAGRAAYQRLAEVMAELLTKEIAKHPEFRLQHVTTRAKEVDSLARKLEDRGVAAANDIEKQVKDLAGCRLVFYTNGDVRRFESSGILSDFFEVDWDRTKFHHPRPEGKTADELFMSNNYVVRLGKQHAAHPEYKRLRDLWCEIQVQTSLNHAWSEMAHDTIYKGRTLRGFGKDLQDEIKNRMASIMQEYLRPAGYEFQKVADDIARLRQGKALFDRDALKELAAARNNNERYDLLKRFAAHVLPHYDDHEAVQAEVRAAVVSAVKASRSAPAVSIETPFGSLSGHSAEQVLEVALNIIDVLRYHDIEGTFDVLSELFLLVNTSGEQRRVLDSVKKLAMNELDVWKSRGPWAQRVLAHYIQRLDLTAPTTARPVVLKALSHILRTEITGTSSTFEAITLHTAAVVVSEPLKEARSAAVRNLTKLFETAGGDEERRAILNDLTRAYDSPHVPASNDLHVLLLESARDVVEFYTRVAPKLPHELRQHIEHTLLLLYRRKRNPRGTAPESPGEKDAREQLLREILAFRDAVNTDREFEVFKILVGFESVFPPAWEDEKFDIEGEDAYRQQQMAALVQQLTEKTADEWLAMLERLAATQSNDGAAFRAFDQFLERLATEKPQVVMSYLGHLSDRLASFLPTMLIGLVASGHAEFVHESALRWIRERRYLRQILRQQRFAVSPEIAIIEPALQAAIGTDDRGAILNAIDAVSAHYGDLGDGAIDRVFIPALRHLVAAGDQRWVRTVRAPAKKPSILTRFTAEQADEVLQAMIPIPEIDYHEEMVLVPFADHWPEKVVDYFGARCSAEARKSSTDRYDAVPYQFHKVHKPLSRIAGYIVGKVREWFSADDSLFVYRAGQLVRNVFPVVENDIAAELGRVVASGRREDALFVASILRGYKGHPSIRPLCKMLVEQLPDGDEFLSEVTCALEETGVLHGPFGRVEALTEKLSAIETWLDDPNERVRIFAARYAGSLRREIAADQRRSEQDIEARRREYVREDDDDKPGSQ